MRRRTLYPIVNWLVVGLGNTGPKYAKSRHNTGFAVLDELWSRTDPIYHPFVEQSISKCIRVSDLTVLLMKPTTYMNLSGEAITSALRFHRHIAPQNILVVYDDIALPPGKLRIRHGGSAGGHNGLKSIIANLGTDQFPRLRIGVGPKPDPNYELAKWVLSDPVGEDKVAIDAAIPRAADAVFAIIQKGIDAAMNLYN